MNKIILTITVIVLSICACKKDNPVAPKPVASFTVNEDTSQSLTIGTYDTYSLINNSTNADHFAWDLGNGTTSTDEEIALYYPKSGIYRLTLTATNKEGEKSVSSKSIKVVDPVLRQVTINSLNWKSALGASTNYPTGDKVNIWVEILQAASNQDYPYLSIGTFDAPLIYRSPVATNIDSSAVPIVFNISSKIIIDIPTLTLSHGYVGRGYGVNLYAEDTTGTYLLCSTYWGVGFAYSGSIPNDNFTIRSGFERSIVTLSGVYE